METAVVYKSVTGNTKMIANAIAAVLGDECVYLGGAEGAPDCELYLVGSWTDKGVCCDEIKGFLKGLSGKKAAYFATCGYGGAVSSEKYYDMLVERARKELPEGCTFLGGFVCQGKMPAAIGERYRQALEKDPGDTRSLQGLELYKDGLSHPDEKDIADAKAWAAEVLSRAKGL